jgi:hypothetical protein
MNETGGRHSATIHAACRKYRLTTADTRLFVVSRDDPRKAGAMPMGFPSSSDELRPMETYFFDIVRTSHVAHDFRGRRMARLDDARVMAEIIAIDCEFEGAVDTKVEVRNVNGMCLLSVSAPQSDLAFA